LADFRRRELGSARRQAIETVILSHLAADRRCLSVENLPLPTCRAGNPLEAGTPAEVQSASKKVDETGDFFGAMSLAFKGHFSLI
jgi:hypothetical protein